MTLEWSAEHVLNIIATLLLFLSGVCATNSEYKIYPRFSALINRFIGPLIISIPTIAYIVVFGLEERFMTLGIVLIPMSLLGIVLIHYSLFSVYYFRRKLEIERAKPDYEAKQKALAAGFLLSGAFTAMLATAFAFVHVNP